MLVGHIRIACRIRPTLGNGSGLDPIARQDHPHAETLRGTGAILCGIGAAWNHSTSSCAYMVDSTTYPACHRGKEAEKCLTLLLERFGIHGWWSCCPS